MWQIPRKCKPVFAYDAWAEILANTYREGGSLSLTGGEEREYVADIAKEVCVCVHHLACPALPAITSLPAA